MCSRNSLDYVACAEHKIRFFNEGMEVYGSAAYARINLLWYVETDRACTQLVEGQESTSQGLCVCWR